MSPNPEPAREVVEEDRWQSDRERLTAEATPDERALADDLRDQLDQLGLHDFAQRQATILHLVVHVIRPFAAKSTPLTPSGYDLEQRARSDHGTYEDAVRFALDVHDDRLQTWEFLNAWGHGDLGEWPEYYEWLASQSALKGQPAASEETAFQARVQPWLMECFGEMIAGDREERNHRFLEEALECVQSLDCAASEAHQLVDYVYGRPAGHPPQEVGGVMVTLAAVCLANDLDMHAAGWVELDRIWNKVEQIKAKQAAKPKHSPLPAAPESGR